VILKIRRTMVGWVAAAAAALSLVLIPVGVSQYQKYSRLNQYAQYHIGSVLWIIYQVEREHARWHELLRQAVDDPQSIAWTDMLLRYEIFASRVGLVQASPILDGMRNDPAYVDAVGKIVPYISEVDAVVMEAQGTMPAPKVLRRLLDQASQHESALRDLTNRSNSLVYATIDESHRTVQQQGLLVLGLVVVQFLILLGSVVALMLYVSRQRRQNLALKEMTRHLKAARAQAEQSSNAKSVFLANMSHEIRTPFQGLLGMLDLLTQTPLSSKQQDYTQTAHDSAQHLLSVLNDILDVSTIESGTLKLAPAPMPLAGVVRDVEALMRPSAKAKGLDLRVELAAGLPEWVLADATRFRQIFFNLLNNAIKFTERGSVTLRMAPSDPPSGVRIDVEDTGIGMDANILDQVFSRFYQADASVSRTFGGVGLGLEISRNLARLMGGDITVRSTPGVGSCFTVTLPLRPVEVPAEPVPSARSGQRRLRILAAEDYPINQKYLRILLAQMGHYATFCSNGQQLLDLLQTQHFDVILMDLHMPVMDGMTAIRAIRAMEGPVAATKIIMVTADSVSDTRQKALDAGADDFVAKPVQVESLQAALLRCGASGDVQGAAPGGESEPEAMPDGAVGPGVPPPVEPVHASVYRDFLAIMPESTVRKLLHSLFDEPGGELCALLHAVAAADRVEVARLAHQIKGACMLAGFKALTATTAELERLALHTEEPLPPSLADQLAMDAARTRQALQAMGQGLTTDLA
jgi:two-component system, sensor histidine kinase